MENVSFSRGDQALTLKLRGHIDSANAAAVEKAIQDIRAREPAEQVLVDVVHERHRIRVALIGIGPLRPEGGDLQGAGLRQHGDGAVLQARFQHPAPGKDGLHLLRPGGGADVPVMGLPAQQRVPDAAAHHIALKALPLQRLQRRGGPSGDAQVHGLPPLPVKVFLYCYCIILSPGLQPGES